MQGDGGQGVVPGIPGIEGLAGALGAGVGNLDVPEDPGPSQKKKKRRKGETADDAETDGGHSPEDLAGEIARRKPQAPMASALELSGDPDDKKKKKKTKKEEVETSDSSYSSEDSVFRLAALPRGVERLRRIQGKLASLTLLRLQEVLLRAQGGGPAQQRSRVPGVARAYLRQIYFAQRGVDQLGPGNTKELLTMATAVDYICQNDSLRALDVLLQRLKALEVAQSQGNWSQAAELELVMTHDQTAIFRQELKAAQQEVKADLDLQKDPQRRSWKPQRWYAAGDAGETAKEDMDKPPDNTLKGPRKGKGRGKKGKGKWRR